MSPENNGRGDENWEVRSTVEMDRWLAGWYGQVVMILGIVNVHITKGRFGAHSLYGCEYITALTLKLPGGL